MRELVKKIGVISLTLAMAIPFATGETTAITAEEVGTLSVDSEGYNVLGSVLSASKDGNKVNLEISTGEKIQFTFLEENVFRMYMAPVGEDFKEYPTANSSTHTATITAKSDSDYKSEYNVSPVINESGDTIIITTSDIKLEIDVATSKMKLMKSDGTVVWEESEPLKYKASETKQTLVTNDSEYFYGGGTQNGRFSHKGTTIKVENTNNWVDAGVASPNPF